MGKFNKLFFLILVIISLSSIELDDNYNLESLKDKNNIIPLAIIGTGPAGLSAAICGARSGINTTIFSGPNPGGQLKDGILVENWPGVSKNSGAEIMSNLEKQAKDFGVTILNRTIKNIDFSSWPFKLDEFYALSIIIATGATPKRLGIENEDKYWIKGILSCPLCDAHLIKNKNTVVIGGGDSAVERVIQLAPYAKEITLILRSNKMRAIYNMYKKVKDFPNVKILFNKDIERFQGDGQRLTGIDIIDTKTKERSTIKVKWVFLSIGFEPNSKLFKKYLDLDPQGYIIHDCKTQETKIKGIYVAGNVSDNLYKQASTASGDGTKAAINASKFLHNILLNKDIKEFVRNNSYSKNQDRSLKIDNISSFQEFQDILTSQENICVEFYSPLCSLCKSIENIVPNIAYKYKDKIKFYKIDILKNRKLMKKYNVSLVPEFLIFKNSKLVDKISEVSDPEKIEEFIESNL